MKRLIILMGFVMILLVGCKNDSDTVAITTDINSYTPLMSSAQGIEMTPDFETKKSYENLVYRWVTAEGQFIGMGKEVENQGEPVIWSAVEDDKVVDIKKTFDIKLEVMDSQKEKILATAKLTITPDDGLYEVKR